MKISHLAAFSLDSKLKPERLQESIREERVVAQLQRIGDDVSCLFAIQNVNEMLQFQLTRYIFCECA